MNPVGTLEVRDSFVGTLCSLFTCVRCTHLLKSYSIVTPAHMWKTEYSLLSTVKSLLSRAWAILSISSDIEFISENRSRIELYGSTKTAKLASSWLGKGFQDRTVPPENIMSARVPPPPPPPPPPNYHHPPRSKIRWYPYQKHPQSSKHDMFGCLSEASV